MIQEARTHTVKVSPPSAVEPLRAESLGWTAIRQNQRKFLKMSNVFSIKNRETFLAYLRARLFSAPLRLVASRWRFPHPKLLLSSGGPSCCSCSPYAPGVPCDQEDRGGAGLLSPAVGLSPGSRFSRPRTLPEGHGSPVWLLSAVLAEC